jgi:hypothetical protein
VTILLVTLLVLAGVLVIGDRVAVHFAETATSDQLAVNAPFAQKPTVRVHGFPFLTQAVGGRYDDVEISGGGLQLGDIKGARLDAHLYGVHLSLSDAFGNKVQELPIDRVAGDVTLPYAELARLIGVSGLSLGPDAGGAVKVTLSASLPVIGQVQAGGTAGIVVQGNEVRLRVEKLSAIGVTIPEAVLAPISQSIQVPVTIPALPYGLEITSVRTGTEGVVVSAAARNVVVPANAS